MVLRMGIVECEKKKNGRDVKQVFSEDSSLSLKHVFLRGWKEEVIMMMMMMMMERKVASNRDLNFS